MIIINPLLIDQLSQMQFISYTKQLIGGDMNQLSWPVYIPVWLVALTLKTVVLAFLFASFFLLSWEACLKVNIIIH